MVGHSAESPIDISDDGSEPSEHGDSGKEGESIDCDEDVDEFESDAGHSSGAAMAKHRAEMQSNEGRGIRVKRSGVKTCIGSPPTKKRSHGLSPNVPFDGEEDGAGHGAEVAMSEYNDSGNLFLHHHFKYSIIY
nr:protein TPR1-like isoform X14 [Ipomoea batatas]GMD26077.1 protein TPR1-like isoform X14 [Ipomoea batatas]